MPEDNHDHELKIIGNGGRTDYRVEAVGFVEGEQLNQPDAVGEKSVEGYVTTGYDIIHFNGAPKGIAFEGEIGEFGLELDGAECDPFHLNMRTITIERQSGDDKAPYRFAVDADGRIIRSESSNPTEVVGPSGTSARGRVRGGKDVWHFAGALTGWPDSNQPLKVTVDNKVLEYDGNPPVGAI